MTTTCTCTYPEFQVSEARVGESTVCPVTSCRRCGQTAAIGSETECEMQSERPSERSEMAGTRARKRGIGCRCRYGNRAWPQSRGHGPSSAAHAALATSRPSASHHVLFGKKKTEFYINYFLSHCLMNTLCISCIKLFKHLKKCEN